MRRFAFILALITAPVHAQSTFDLAGYVAARGVNATGPPSWLQGGFGRLEAEGDRDDFFASAHAGFDWTPSKYFDVHVAGTARHDPEGFGGDDVGLVEAYADLRAEWGFDSLRLRGGQFFLPTSHENIDPLWASPYTINFSAINTWIGEEVRPIGLDLEYRHTTGRGHVIAPAFTAFRGNDTMGTLLGWRGWSVGDRLTTYGEVLPLPPLGSLDTYFFRQRDDGTQPFNEDLDGKTGYAARLRYIVPQRGSFSLTRLDNKGDRALYNGDPDADFEGGEYSWYTEFDLIGAEIGDPDNLVLATEYMRGETSMGLFENYVEAEFYSAYVLVSEKRGRNRWSARYEIFGSEDLDQTAAESNEETGRSWTFTWMYDLMQDLRITGEFTQITGDRPAAQQYGFDPDTNGRTFTVEARYRF